MSCFSVFIYLQRVGALVSKLQQDTRSAMHAEKHALERVAQMDAIVEVRLSALLYLYLSVSVCISIFSYLSLSLCIFSISLL